MSRPLILVTGGAGFIGSNIVAGLVGSFDVSVCDRFRTASAGKWRNLAHHPVNDLIEPDGLFAWLEEHRDDLMAVVHMGAISSTSETDVDLIVRTNFTLSKSLWNWCADANVRLIYASSAATYGDGSLGFSDKDDLAALSALRPLNAYGWSKSMFDIYAKRSASRGVAPPQWTGLKFFNVYGPNEQHKGSMKSVVAQIWPRVRDGETVSLFRSHVSRYVDGGQMRDFIYVKDVEAVVTWLLGRVDVSGVFNLGSGTARAFKDLAEATFRAAGREPEITYIDTPEAIRGAYQYFTQADMARLRTAGYNGEFTPLEVGVTDYVQTYLAAADPYR